MFVKRTVCSCIRVVQTSYAFAVESVARKTEQNSSESQTVKLKYCCRRRVAVNMTQRFSPQLRDLIGIWTSVTTWVLHSVSVEFAVTILTRLLCFFSRPGLWARTAPTCTTTVH